MSTKTKRVKFDAKVRVSTFVEQEAATVFATCDSEADDSYVSKAERARAKWVILSYSDRKVSIANGGRSHGKYVTKLPIKGLSNKAVEADTFDSFPQSLASVHRQDK